jgi:hypothetical protein
VFVCDNNVSLLEMMMTDKYEALSNPITLIDEYVHDLFAVCLSVGYKLAIYFKIFILYFAINEVKMTNVVNSIHRPQFN